MDETYEEKPSYYDKELLKNIKEIKGACFYETYFEEMENTIPKKEQEKFIATHQNNFAALIKLWCNYDIGMRMTKSLFGITAKLLLADFIFIFWIFQFNIFIVAVTLLHLLFLKVNCQDLCFEKSHKKVSNFLVEGTIYFLVLVILAIFGYYVKLENHDTLSLIREFFYYALLVVIIYFQVRLFFIFRPIYKIYKRMEIVSRYFNPRG